MELQAQVFASMSLAAVSPRCLLYHGSADVSTCWEVALSGILFTGATGGGTFSPENPVTPVSMRLFHVRWLSHCYILEASPPATRIPFQEPARFSRRRDIKGRSML